MRMRSKRKRKGKKEGIMYAIIMNELEKRGFFRKEIHRDDPRSLTKAYRMFKRSNRLGEESVSEATDRFLVTLIAVRINEGRKNK